MLNTLRTIAITLLTSLLIACSDQPSVNDQSQQLANINADTITQTQLDIAIQALLGQQQSSQLDQRAKNKILQSILASKAIAQQARQRFSDDLLLEIHYKTQAYKERLLVNEYLKQHAQPAAITSAMVQDYYKHHQADYGGGLQRHYEMITTDNKPSEANRDKLLKIISALTDQSEWQIQVKHWQSKGVSLSYRSGIVNRQVLNQKLLQLLDSVKNQQTSTMTFIDGKPTIVRITVEKVLKAQPLHEVSADIRQKLLPIQLKAAIKVINDKILSESNIEYLTKEYRP